MASKVQKTSPSNPKANPAKNPSVTTAKKTPAQTEPAPAYAIDATGIAKDKTWGRGGYGANAFGGASSDTTGKRTRASLSVNNDDTDPVLNDIKSRGTARGDMTKSTVGDDSGRDFLTKSSVAFPGAQNVGDGLLRDLATGNSHVSHNKSAPPPLHPSMAPNTGSKSGKVESGLDWQTENPVRQPPKGNT